MADSMLITKDWLEKLKSRTNEAQYQEVCAKILDYGIFGEYNESADALVNVHLDWLLPQIDMVNSKYQERVNRGKKGGRASNIDDREIWKLAHDEKLKGREIAERLGIPESTLFSRRGWKERKDANFLRNYEND